MKKFLVIGIMLVLAGCANTNPVVDLANVDYGTYQQDLYECQLYAEQDDTVGNGLVGTGLGAGLGAGTGALTGVILDGVATGPAVLFGTAIGGIIGSVIGVSESNDRQEMIVRNCLRGRGYNVLD